MRGGGHAVLKVDGLQPAPEAGCSGRLSWRLDLPRSAPYSRIYHRLELRGYRGRCHQPFLQVLRTIEGHEIVLVPTTGRVQLRIYHLTPATERQRVVITLAGDLAACLAE